MPRTPNRRPVTPVPTRPEGTGAVSVDSALATEIKALLVQGERDRARELFGELVAHPVSYTHLTLPTKA